MPQHGLGSHPGRVFGEGLGVNRLAVLLQPFAVGMLGGDPLLDLPVLEDLLLFQIHRDHLTGAKATFLDNLRFRQSPPLRLPKRR